MILYEPEERLGEHIVDGMIMKDERRYEMLNWRITDRKPSAGSETLTIWRADEYLIGGIGGCFNLYRDETKLGLFRSLKEAKAEAERDRQSRA